MNKTDFIKKFQSKTEYSAIQCALINDVLENHFIFHKKNRSVIVDDFAEKLSVDKDEAESIYELCMSIISAEKKRVLKRPFGSN